MISKELLSRVLELNIILVDTKYTETTKRIRYVTSDNNDYYIDVYNLAHKCKEWAIGEYGFSLHSFPCPDDTYTCEIYKFHKSTGYVIVDWFNCLSEVEAIFRACQWILLDNKESK